jgi:iron complex transport system ATP-binding protein
MFEVCALSFSYPKRPLFENLSVSIDKREFVSVVGPNGAGKSTFVKLLARLLHPSSGDILFNNTELDSISRRDLAKNLAYVAQESRFSLDFTVIETVLQGRHPYLGALERYHSADYALARSSLERLGILHLAEKSINNISSGERQLAVIARSLVQEPSVILLDEPLNHLDLAHQHEVLVLLKSLNEEGVCIVLVAHDLNQAALCSNRMLIFAEGKLCEDNSPDALLKPDIIERYWGVRPLEGRHPETGKRQIFLPI